MRTTVYRRLAIIVLAAAVSSFLPSRSEALYMQWEETERPVDWRVGLGGREFGIAEEVHVKKSFFNRFDGREVLSSGTAIHFGFGVVTVPCRLMVFVTAVVGILIGVIVLAMLPSLRRRGVVSRVSDQQLVEENT